jgi:plastocyanin
MRPLHLRSFRTPAFVLALAIGVASCSSYGSTGPMGGGGTGGGGTGAVTVGDDFFSPATTTVPAGTTVSWTWTGQDPHNVNFDDGAPSSGVKTSGTFTRTFTTPGTYTYFCSVHGRAVMSGSVVVQ